MEQLYYWCFEVALWISGIVYASSRDRREKYFRRFLGCSAGYLVLCMIFNHFFIGSDVVVRLWVRVVSFLLLILFQYTCWENSWSVAVYDSIWASMSWQLLYGLGFGVGGFWDGTYQYSDLRVFIRMVLTFAIGYLIVAFTIARWVPEWGPKKIGPRQLVSALMIFVCFQIIGLGSGNMEIQSAEGKWMIIYLSQLLLALILYLQNEVFKKSALRQELEVMNLLWKKEQEQYELSKENIALINQKCHDLKHQIRAIRNSSKEDIEQYLMELEGTVQIYESIVKTGNEVLDTILTEKSLYCRERGITVSCVADGSQMDFINTVDLYAILGNALDNAIEAVEKFKHKEKRQIDVLIYRQQNFLVINVINPMKESLVYEEELPVSTKGDKRYHGFGLRSMRYLVKKYDGILHISEEDGCFSLKILMPVPR